MVGNTEINMFEVRRPSTTVCCILVMLVEHVFRHLSESQRPTCDT